MANPAVQKRVVVVGNGMVGQRFVERSARAGPATGAWHVTVSARSRGAPTTGSRCRPTSTARRRAISTSCADGVLRRPGLRAAPRTTRWSAIDRAARYGHAPTGGRRYGYDALVLATGSYPFVPPVPGHDLPGCFVYRTIDDLDAIRERGQGGGSATAGRAAGAGRRRRPARARGGRRAAAARHVAARRRAGAAADAAAGRRGRRRAAAAADRGARRHRAHRRVGRRSIDARPRARLLADADQRHRTRPRRRGVLRRHPAARRARPRRPASTVGPRGGVVVDDGCRTSDDAHLRDRRVRAASAAGSTAWSRPATRWPRSSPTGCSAATPAFTGADMSTKLKLLGVDVASFGDAHATDRGRARGRRSTTRCAGAYAKLVVSDDAADPARRRPRRRRLALRDAAPAGRPSRCRRAASR